MVYKSFVYAILFFCFSCFNCVAAVYAPLDNFIANAKSVTKSVSGTSVVLIKDGKIVHESHTGMADVERQIPVDTNSVYYFASTTKAIMGLAVLQAEQQGLLKKDSTLKQLFPNVEFRYIDANNYTIKDLLSHRSGLINEAMAWTFSYTGNHDKAKRLRFVSSLKPHPNIKKGEFGYTNLGYNLLAIWFDENVKGGWTSAINTLVLSPVGMKNSTADVNSARVQGWPIPKPYSYKFQDGQKEIYMNKNNDTLYSVGIFARPNDWARLITHLLPVNAVSSAFPASVVKDSQRLLVSEIDSYFSGYGWGWMHSEIAGERVLMHTGGFDGASVQVSYSPEKNIGVVIVHNESGLIANQLNGSISEIAYKMLTEQAVIELINTHQAGMVDIAAHVEKAKIDITAKRAQLSKRISMSPKLMSSLEGKYENIDAGTIVIKQRDNDLYLSWGSLQSKVYNGLVENEFVVELRPGKFFEMKRDKNVSSIELKGWQFSLAK
jgi:CubicO group peptidase (beta-lactamase class C family)